MTTELETCPFCGTPAVFEERPAGCGYVSGQPRPDGARLTVQTIAAAVEKIEAAKDDDEGAHEMEDRLRAEFIRHVAETAGGELAEMARAVMKTEEIRLCRWCA